MKKLLSSLIIILSFVASAQDCVFKDSIFESILKTQNIFDGRMKAFSFDTITKLSPQIIIDTDKNGKISMSEAKNVYELYVTDGLSNNIKSLNGLACFSEMVKLTLSGLTIDSVSINNSKLTSLHLINNPSLRVLNVSNLLLDTVIVASNLKLEELILNNNADLKVLDCSNNDTLQNIDVSNCPNISILSSINSSISQIDLTTNILLRNLILKNNKLQKITLNNNSLIQILVLDDNQLDTIDISNQPELIVFSCNNTNISMIDASHNLKLKTIDIANNSNLSNVNLKNGSKLNEIYLSNVPNLKYICTDNVNKIAIMDTIKLHGNSKIEVNSYCTEKPGGYTNNIKGRLTFDSDGNGCDGNDTISTVYTKFLFENSQYSEYSFVNQSNAVNFYSLAGTYNLKPIIDTNYFTVIPSSSNLSFMDSLNRDTTVNFCLRSKNSFKDIEILIIPTNSAIIGDTVTHEVLIRNKSSILVDGSIDLIFNDSLVHFVNSAEFNLVAKNKLHGDFVHLTPFQTRKFPIVFKIKSKLEVPTISLNDSLIFSATVNPNGLDVFTIDNTFVYKQPLRDSIKSNFITCLNGNSILKNNPINYLINFDYNSKKPFTNTVIKQIIDTSKFETSSIQLIQSSTPARISISDNTILFYIDNKTAEHKHGNILLRYQGFKFNDKNDTILQKADIYFDFNKQPYQTDVEVAITKEKLLTQIKNISLDQSIKVFPNPSNGFYNLTANSQINMIEIYDTKGRNIKSIISNDVENNIDITTLESGIYLLKIITSSGANVLEIQKD